MWKQKRVRSLLGTSQWRARQAFSEQLLQSVTVFGLVLC